MRPEAPHPGPAGGGGGGGGGQAGRAQKGAVWVGEWGCMYRCGLWETHYRIKDRADVV